MKVSLLTVRAGGAPVWSEREGHSIEAIRAAAIARGETILSHKLPMGALATSSLRLRQSKPLDLDIFCTQLTVLLDAGLPIPEALRTLQANSQGAAAVGISALSALIQEGKTLGQAAKALPAHFPDLFASLIQSAEKTSDVSNAIRRYQHFRQTVDGLRQQLWSASVYPLTLSVVGMAVVGFLLIYVVPRFSSVYASIQTELPIAARVMLVWGNWMSQHSTLVFTIVGVLLALLFAVLINATIRQRVFSAILERPMVNQWLMPVYLSRLYRSMGMLLAGGVPVFTAMQMSAQSLPRHLASQVSQAAIAVGTGLSASDSLARHQLTTPVSRNLLLAGEGTGELGRMFDESARFLETETTTRLERTMKVFEPALMTVIGVIIGVIVILMYMPIFELAGALQ